MIVNFIKIVTEYLGMILCIHKVAGKRLSLVGAVYFILPAG